MEFNFSVNDSLALPIFLELPWKLYPTIIKSEAVLKNILYKKYQTREFSQPVNLIEYWEIEAKTPELQFEIGLKSLTELLQVNME